METLVKKPDYDNAADTAFLVKDLVQGDESVASREDFNRLSDPELQHGLDLILRNPSLSSKVKEQLILDSWRINYKQKPPTIEEFLSSEWLGPTAGSIFPHNQRILKEFFQYQSPYRHLILGAAIGTGKSSLSSIANLFVTTNLFLMRNAKKFFGLAAFAPITTALISFNLDKAKQVLLQPFMTILSSSPKFYRVKIEERLEFTQKEHPDKICWTTAGRVGVLQFPGDLHYIIASDPGNILGLNLIQATMSEISFFVDKGFSTEYIWRIYTDAKERVKSRFGDKYLAGTILDSSPNDIDASPIDKYIFTGQAEKDPENYVVTGSQWELFDEDPQRKRTSQLYPKYVKTGETFPVFRGSSSQPPLILNETNLDQYPAEEVLHVPIDLRRSYEENTVRAVKNTGGWPSGSLDKLIREQSLIENIFTPQLRNIPTYILAPSTKKSEELIWSQIKDRFFINVGGHYEFYRAPRARRVLSFDLAETGDMLGIAMSHWEWDTKREEKICVHDFTIAISPGKGRINLDAIRTFPEDLRDKGHIDIYKITFDNFQSHMVIQYLKEKGFNVETLSADLDMNVYLTYIALINIGLVRAGRNIFLKNNLRSIQEVTSDKGHKKIDHMIGKVVNVLDTNDWTLSRMGTCAKDISDACSESAYVLIHELTEPPRYVYKSELDVPFDSVYMGEAKNTETESPSYSLAFRKDFVGSFKDKGFKIKSYKS